MAGRASTYVHGSEPEEQRRLARLNDLLNARALAEIAPPRGARVLDVGSGLAQLARGFARAVGPGGLVVGVERDARQLAEARRLLGEAEDEGGVLELRAGEATALPLAAGEWGTFDVAHARFLLEHVPDPLAVVRAMVRAVRPGGRVVLQDDDHDLLRPWPEPEGFAALWRAYQQGFVHAGNDPLVGRRLVELLHAAGARPTRNAWLFFGSCAGADDFPAYVANLAGVIASSREAVLAAGGIGEEAFARGLDAVRTWGERPDAALWYGVAYAEGVRPSA